MLEPALGSVQIDRLDVGGDADISAGGLLALRGNITLRADMVQAGLVSSTEDGKVTELTGLQGRRASTVVVTMDTPSAWQMPVLNAVDAQLSTNGSSTAMAVASIGAGLRLSTPDGVVAMNNQAQGLSGGAAVQFFTPTQDVALVRDGKQFNTSAPLVSQRGDQTVVAPRLFTPVAGQIPTSGLAVSGPAAASHGGRAMAGGAGTQAAANGPLSAPFPQLRRLANGQWAMGLRRTAPRHAAVAADRSGGGPGVLIERSRFDTRI